MNDLTRIKAVREAGEVLRCHALPHHSRYTLASHSYGAVNLLLLLHPDPSVRLIKALMWHDVAERWLGDVPSPGKNVSLRLREAYEEAEQYILRCLGFNPQLTDEEQQWLHAMDLADLMLWADTEVSQFSNIAASPMLHAAEKSLQRLMAEAPSGGALQKGLSLLLHHQSRGDLSDRLSDFRWTETS